MNTTFENLEPWYSLRHLLEKHSTASIATAIEIHGIWVLDRYRRKAKASVEVKNDYSQSKALDLVADWAEEMDDPNPTYSWDHERFDLVSHPTERFGWPAHALPSFTDLKDSTLKTNSRVSQKKYWVAAAHKEAEAVLMRERSKGHEPKQENVAKEVSRALASKGIKTKRGAISALNVQREALTGDFWQKSRPRPQNEK